MCKLHGAELVSARPDDPVRAGIRRQARRGARESGFGLFGAVTEVVAGSIGEFPPIARSAGPFRHG
jgi:hypothetical protein